MKKESAGIEEIQKMCAMLIECDEVIITCWTEEHFNTKWTEIRISGHKGENENER